MDNFSANSHDPNLAFAEVSSSYLWIEFMRSYHCCGIIVATPIMATAATMAIAKRLRDLNQKYAPTTPRAKNPARE